MIEFIKFVQGDIVWLSVFLSYSVLLWFVQLEYFTFYTFIYILYLANKQAACGFLKLLIRPYHILLGFLLVALEGGAPQQKRFPWIW